MKRARLSALFFVCLSLLPVAGCWDNRELNDQALQIAAGIDLLENGDYLLSNQYAKSSQSSQSDQGQKIGFYTETAVGRTLLKGSSALQKKVTRQINRGQRLSLAISEKMAKRGLRDLLDYYTRNPEAPIRMDLFVVKGSMAADLLKNPVPFGSQPLREYYKLHQSNFETADIVFMNLVRALNEPSKSGEILPVLEAVPAPSGKKNGNKQSLYRYSGSAVMSNEAKLVGYLNEEETGYVLWMLDRPHRQALSVPVSEERDTVSIELRRMNAKRSLSFDGGVKMTITLTGDATLLENNSNLDMMTPEVPDAIKRKLEQDTEKRIGRLVKKLQNEVKSDVIHVGDTIFRNRPGRWRSLMNNWDAEFAQAKITVRVRLKFVRFGLTGAPGHLRENDIQRS